jgi:hypothetical protein
MGAPAAPAEIALHCAPNHNFALDGSFLPTSAGFNLADVSRLREIKQLKPGNRALVWIGRCGGVDQAFLSTVRAYAGSRNLFGFFLMDDPDPRPLAGVMNPSHACTVSSLRAEADWIHDNIPGAKTLIVLMNMASAVQPSFKGTYEPANSHVDLFGLAAYPCRTDLPRCDYDIIDRYVAAAIDAGISRDRIVPIYQAFGGGAWFTDAGGRYYLPNQNEEIAILSRWRQLVPSPEMDMAYSWGSQRGDRALESSSELQAVFAKHNRSTVGNEQTP